VNFVFTFWVAMGLLDGGYSSFISVFHNLSFSGLEIRTVLNCKLVSACLLPRNILSTASAAKL
jgi:hypothetical protein